LIGACGVKDVESLPLACPFTWLVGKAKSMR
jgi:hypothetical protein